MTFLEELKEEIPNKNSIWYLKQVEEFCPGEFGYEDTNPECDYDGCDIEMCEECWNREMPNTEAKTKSQIELEKIEDSLVHGVDRKELFEHISAYGDAIADTHYNKGLNDGRNEAWGLARTLYDKKVAEVEKIFDVEGGFWNVIRDFTPQEALAKLKAYEEAQIEVGDVVTYSGERGMVLDSIPSKFVVLTHDGWVQEWYECDVEKTGKHIALDGLLEQIGGITWE